MNNAERSTNEEQNIFPATVVYVPSEYRVAINRGTRHGIKERQRFLVYGLSAGEVTDPTTGASLGHLELVKGTGTVLHVQESMSTITSDMFTPAKKRVIKKPTGWQAEMMMGLRGDVATEEVVTTEPSQVIPFSNVRVGDNAKPV